MSSPTVSTKLQWIAQAAVSEPGRIFTSLAHLIDMDFLKEAFNRTRKDAAPGADGVTAEEYAGNLDENLHDLHERLRTGRYKAPPVKRVWLDKDDGGKRPIGVPTIKDRIVQCAVKQIMEPLFEASFWHVSYGFRPGRGCHGALEHIRWQSVPGKGRRMENDMPILTSGLSRPTSRRASMVSITTR